MIHWYEIAKRKPPENTLLMVAGESGYIKYSQFLTLAYYDEEYRPSLDGTIRWLNVQNDALLDKGWQPSHWALQINMPVTYAN